MPENDTNITAGRIVPFRQHVRLDPVYYPFEIDVYSAAPAIA